MRRSRKPSHAPSARPEVLKINGSIRLLRSSVEQIDRISTETGMARSAVIRLATAEGLRRLFPAA